MSKPCLISIHFIQHVLIQGHCPSFMSDCYKLPTVGGGEGSEKCIIV